MVSLRTPRPTVCDSQATARTASASVHVDLVHQPGRGHPGELGRGGAVEVERGVGVPLQEGGGDFGVELPFDGTADDVGLVLAGGEDGDLAGLEDRGDAHGERLTGNVLLAEEVGGRVTPGNGVERDEPGAALEPGPRLVEADVARLADAEELKVDAPGGA